VAIIRGLEPSKKKTNRERRKKISRTKGERGACQKAISVASRSRRSGRSYNRNEEESPDYCSARKKRNRKLEAWKVATAREKSDLPFKKAILRRKQGSRVRVKENIIQSHSRGSNMWKKEQPVTAKLNIGSYGWEDIP